MDRPYSSLVSQQLIIDGAINKAGVENHHTFYTSDHNLCAINLNVNKIIGKVQRVTCVKDVRRRMLRSTDTLSAKRYVEEIEYIEEEKRKAGHVTAHRCEKAVRGRPQMQTKNESQAQKKI